jgi:16S rRNA G966 N2-methylase RsmD
MQVNVVIHVDLLCRTRSRGERAKADVDAAKAEFVFTDPPYNVAIDGNVCGLGRIRHER